MRGYPLESLPPRGGRGAIGWSLSRCSSACPTGWRRLRRLGLVIEVSCRSRPHTMSRVSQARNMASPTPGICSGGRHGPVLWVCRLDPCFVRRVNRGLAGAGASDLRGARPRGRVADWACAHQRMAARFVRVGEARPVRVFAPLPRDNGGAGPCPVVLRRSAGRGHGGEPGTMPTRKPPTYFRASMRSLSREPPLS